MTNQDQKPFVRQSAESFNTSKFTLRDLRARASQQQLKPTSRPIPLAIRPTSRNIFDNSSSATKSASSKRTRSAP